ncbi:hypothetical protein [Streptomyces himalayensis]|uniref:Uncharacterized protein n=1 Tax=Streptomyces himalayensis subsp. himalayensis TaxID=2756131 RepID=A0A7W0DUB6_9ACTN|nr:hypothetical protein [Streptomyces himalayensis]MBA2951412.1 hypothetical protein [Streptomyces himalayensis subsp. himalayensis]
MTYGEVDLMANTELLRKTLQHIKDNPEQWDQKRWHKDFAGWSLRLGIPDVKVNTDADGIETLYQGDDRVWIDDIATKAEELLQLDRGQAIRLFCGANTMDDLSALVDEFATFG